MQKLADAGIKVERFMPNGFDFEAAWYAYGIIMGTEVGLGVPTKERLPLSLISVFLPKSQPLSGLVTAGMSFDWKRYNEALNIRERLILQIEQFLENWDAWLCLVTPSVAFLHIRLSKFKKPPKIMVDDYPLPYLEGTVSMIVPFSLTGNPAVSLPAGVIDGLPIGSQIIGKRWHDEELLDNCRIIKLATGGFQPPSGYHNIP